MREETAMPEDLDRASGASSSSLLPMLIAGLVLIVIGMVAVAALS